MVNDNRSSQVSPSVEKELKKHGLHLEDERKVCWDDDNEAHPRNWSLSAKAYNNALIFWLEFFMTFISTSGTSAATSAMKEYGINRTLSYFAFTSIYLIGQTIGSIFCSPISETFGRRTLYILSALIFCVFNVIVAAVPSLIAVFFGRFITGFVAAIPATLAFGNFDDTHDWEVRIWIVYFYTLFGNMGLVLGPIYSAYVVDTIGWRWVFYIATIASGISAAAALFMKESRATSLLDKKVAEIKKETGQDNLKTESSDQKLTFESFVRDSLFRPLQFLVTEPTIFFCAALCSIAYGLIYGLTESITIVYESFGWSKANSSLAFLPILLGLVLNILPRFYDQHLFKKFKAQNRTIKPETKIRSFAIACPALALGLWIFAWSIPPRVPNVHWIVSMIGLVLVGFPANDFAYVLFGYVTDLYGPYAASAVASLNLSRTLVAAAFPLFTTQMYQGVGSNVATSILAAVATLFAFTPFLFLGHAEKLAGMSKFAQKGGEGGEVETSEGRDGNEKGEGENTERE